MNHVRNGSQTLTKEINRAKVIDVLRVQSLLSRTDIAQITKLGLSTITSIVDNLMRENLVTEVGTGESHGGRKPMLLRFNGDASYVIGVKVEQDQVKLCLSNLAGELINKVQYGYECRQKGQLSAILIECIETFIRSNECAFAISGIGLAISGLVNREKCELIHSPMLGMDYEDLRPISKYLGLPLIVDNDANTYVLAEKWVGIGRDYRNFIGVTVGAGIGAGVIIDHCLYRGDAGGAGELGHIIIHREGRRCYCGQMGCLESYVSDSVLVQEALRRKTDDTASMLGEYQRITPEAVVDAAEKGDKAAQDLLFQQGEALGIGIKSMVHLFNPEAVVIGGEGMRAGRFIVEGIRKELSNYFFVKHQGSLRLHVSGLGPDGTLIGACALVVSDLFRSPIYK